MGYAGPPGPSPKEKRMFLWGIIGGALLGIVGNFLVTSLFRFIDSPSGENIYYLVLSLVLFPIILCYVLFLAKRVMK